MISQVSAFVQETFALVDGLDAIADREVLASRLETHLAKAGVEHFVMSRLPEPGRREMSPLVLVERWPGEWASHYDEMRYAVQDPILARLGSTFEPFAWADVPVDRASQPTAFRMMQESRELGMAEGWAIPIFDPSGAQGCISLAGRALDQRPEILRAVHMLGLFAFAAAERIHNLASAARTEPLTAREQEVLRWIAVGRSQSEVADLLDISERTVEVHLRNARLKLRTTNTTHTTVVALLRREIRL